MAFGYHPFLDGKSLDYVLERTLNQNTTSIRVRAIQYNIVVVPAFCSYNGTTLTAGRYAGRKAVWFNQSGSSISAPAVVLNGKNLTIACWIKRASDDRGVQTIYADRAHSSHTMHFSFLIKHGTLRFKRAAIEGNPVAQIASEAQVPVGEWAHVAVTWLHEDRLGSLHLDTVEVASQQFGPEYSPFSAPRKSHYLIGNDHWDGNEFVGAIADLYVLNVVLSPDDLNLLRGGCGPAGQVFPSPPFPPSHRTLEGHVSLQRSSTKRSGQTHAGGSVPFTRLPPPPPLPRNLSPRFPQTLPLPPPTPQIRNLDPKNTHRHGLP